MLVKYKTRENSLNSTMKLTVEDKALFSVFQPVYSFSNQACVGVEALVRGRSLKTGFQVPVPECLSVPEGESSAVFNQKLNQMHLHNWQALKLPNTWLFLNLDIQEISNLEDLCVGKLIADQELLGHEVVVEVVENEIVDEALFLQVIERLRQQGCLIALDDFGAGHSNIDRIWKVQPDIVKLDRGVLLEATRSARSESILRNLTRLIKQAGSVSLLEGVETKEQALLAMDVGVDLVQGYYFARPQPFLDQVKAGQACLEDVTASYPAYLDEQKQMSNRHKATYHSLFETLADVVLFTELELKMARAAEHSFVKRFYILDDQGYQVSEDSYQKTMSDCIDVLRKGKGLCWRNRNYFMSAIAQPEAVFVSEPYRSLIDMQLCLTISKVVELAGSWYVACFDVHYYDRSTDTGSTSV
ncbi:EAL domain-containing protein [Hydrogenovibrio sp. SC-1]|uniref:EAL domain-containing protein n=1 Tax=Hydrogenovibrio sp. SC-1 TaxID=2065820 RepID=UPI00130461DA|nr:EAL domain-containing protein [Hydrogenovibrio sp. SC-1]